jgi:thioredoxin reductase (NADPH)
MHRRRQRDLENDVTQRESVRVLIIGGGPAAYTAAIYAARAGLAPVCVEGYSSGGQIMRSASLHNFPGFPEGIAGADLADRIREQAAGFGARFVMAEVQSVDFDASPLVVSTDETEYVADAVIVATGANARVLGLPSEEEFLGRGVAYCAICDGAFFAGRRVAVIGGGDAALEEAVALSRIAAHVLLVHRRDGFRANANLQDVMRSTPGIDVLTPHVVTEILGTDDAGVTGLRTQHVDTGQLREHEIDGVFVSIGHEPSSALFTRWLVADEDGFIRSDLETRATNVPGVFVAGDVSDRRYRQAVTAAASGAAAAIDAERWLDSHRGIRPVPATRAEAPLTIPTR